MFGFSIEINRNSHATTDFIKRNFLIFLYEYFCSKVELQHR